MKINIEGIATCTPEFPAVLPRREFPHSTKEIYLYEWIMYEQQYGIDINKRGEEMVAKGDCNDELLILAMEQYETLMSFYMSIPMEQVRKMPSRQIVDAVSGRYLNWSREQASVAWNAVHSWNGTLWQVQAPFVEAPVPKRADEFMPVEQKLRLQADIATEIALITSDVKDGDVTSCLEMAAMFFRIKDEPYHPDMMEERKKLMIHLPMFMFFSVFKHWKEAYEHTATRMQ
jgi:hypothetical protein